MPTTSITMRKLKEILRLKYGCKLSHRQIAKSLSVSPSVVSRYSSKAAELGIACWPLDDKWNDQTLQQSFFKTKPRLKGFAIPDWSLVQQELRPKTMTLLFLWNEYTERHPEGFYSYTHFCRQYKVWLKCQKPSMRQNHKAGEKLFVDYCGSTINIVDASTGECRTAQVFVAVMGASNYTYAEATYSQKLEDWVMSHARCFTFLGGVPELVIPDNLKSAVTNACRYEPDLNPTYQQFAAHYDTVIVPARPYKPKDKAKAEVGVHIVERWIMVRLRKEILFSLRQLNLKIGTLLVDLNQRKMKKHPGTRLSQFEAIDQPALQPLPAQSYIYTLVKQVRVHIDYHVEVEKHYYSVPYTLIKQKLEAHVTGQLVTLYHQGLPVAAHPRSCRQGAHTTVDAHMPVAHQQQLQWTPQRFENWARQFGGSTEQFVIQLIQAKKHPEQSYRACMGLLSLSKKFTEQRLESACYRALPTGVTRVKQIKSILEKGLDKQPLPEAQDDLLREIDHQNIRGNLYYH